MKCIKILPHVINDEYESSNIAYQKETVSISGNTNLNQNTPGVKKVAAKI